MQVQLTEQARFLISLSLVMLVSPSTLLIPSASSFWSLGVGGVMANNSFKPTPLRGAA